MLLALTTVSHYKKMLFIFCRDTTWGTISKRHNIGNYKNIICLDGGVDEGLGEEMGEGMNEWMDGRMDEEMVEGMDGGKDG